MKWTNGFKAVACLLIGSWVIHRQGLEYLEVPGGRREDWQDSQARVFWFLLLSSRTIPRLTLITIDLAISWIVLLIVLRVKILFRLFPSCGLGQLPGNSCAVLHHETRKKKKKTKFRRVHTTETPAAWSPPSKGKC